MTDTPQAKDAPDGGISRAEFPAVLDAACARLKASGLRLTRPRLAILSELIRKGAPASIEDLHFRIGASRCDLVTVYRCIAAFEAAGLVRRDLFLRGSWLYSLRLDGPERFHVACRATGRVAELDAESAAALSRALHAAEEKLLARGFTAIGHVVEFSAQAQKAES
jgi:Fur family ferric uptake transcriptional regulator